ncbi:MAG: phosphoribosylformylglycinamidine synthase subunit PurS [Cyanobacteria bacterium P01_A01_bin.84]
MQRKYRAKIHVTLRPSVLDPAGTAVESGLSQLGFDNVEKIRIGKYIELYITCPDEKRATDQLNKVCEGMLANTVIENYHFELTEVESQTGSF